VWGAFETFATVVFYWPILKLFGYGTIFLMLVTLSRREDEETPSHFALGVEIVVVCFLLLLAQDISLQHLPRPLLGPARLDIATTVLNALKSLFVFHENPYNPSSLSRWTTFSGVAFAYGPMMMVGYFPYLYSSTYFKLCSFLYLFGIWALTMRFAVQGIKDSLPRLAAAVFATAVLMMPRAVLNDVSEGINDHFPVFLLLLSLTLFQRNKRGWAGVVAGLSLSAKFSPAAFLLVLLIRRRFPVRFFVGVAVGCLPMLPFFLWDPARFVHDIVYFHFVKAGTPTSIYTITPPELHRWLRYLKVVFVALFIIRNFAKEIEIKSLMYEFTLLVILINALHIEMHSNYLVWILPTSAILFTGWRFRAASLGRGLLGWNQGIHR
jgi:hypothetical protein